VKNLCIGFSDEPSPTERVKEMPTQKCHPERSHSQPHRGRRSRRTCVWLATLLLLAPFRLCAQAQTSPIAPTKTFHDPIYHLAFDYPANWTFAHSDGEISTFHLDARSAPAKTRLRAVVAMPENPFPASTFSGAYLYFSVIPHTTATACAKQASSTTIVKNVSQIRPGEKTHIADILFTHGHDEVKDICLTQHDEIYTARHGAACYRFDLAINNFCGGDVSGVKDITAQELDQVRARLQSIFSTIRFDPK
jgi:hypothetical protein